MEHIGTGCNRGSHRSAELDALRKPFRRKEGILCDSCATASHGWRCTWLERRDSARQRDSHEEQTVISILYGLYSEPKPHPRFYQSNCPPIHLNYTWMSAGTITALRSLLSTSLSLAVFFFFFTSFPLFHFSSPSIGIYMSMTSCVSAFLFFSVAYLHVSGFCCLMVLR